MAKPFKGTINVDILGDSEPKTGRLLTGRNHDSQQHGLYHRGSDRLPGRQRHDPPENGMASEILVERGWNTYLVGKCHGTVAVHRRYDSSSASQRQRQAVRGPRARGRRDDGP